MLNSFKTLKMLMQTEVIIGWYLVLFMESLKRMISKKSCLYRLAAPLPEVLLAANSSADDVINTQQFDILLERIYGLGVVEIEWAHLFFLCLPLFVDLTYNNFVNVTWNRFDGSNISPAILSPLECDARQAQKHKVLDGRNFWDCLILTSFHDGDYRRSPWIYLEKKKVVAGRKERTVQ